VDLVDASLVASARELRLDPSLHDLDSGFRLDHTRAEGEHIRIIVLAAHLRFEYAVTSRSANARNLVSGHIHPDTCSAHQHTHRGPLIGNRLGNLSREIRIIHGIGGVCAEILDLHSLLAQALFDLVLQLETGMVRAEGDLHEQHCTLRHILVALKPAIRALLACIDADFRGYSTINSSFEAREFQPAEVSMASPANPEIKIFKFIDFEIRDNLARITLNNPPYNTLTVPLMGELADAIESLEGKFEVKCILLNSSQKTFSAGISIEDSKPDRVFQTLEAFNRVFQAIAEISKPLIVVVNGPAIGAGSELVAFGDMIIATPNARFAQPEVKMGVFPPFAAIMLPAVIGPKKTYELILTGQSLTAEEALQLGFVNRVVPEAELQTTVNELVARIVEFSAPVLEMTKRVIATSIGRPLGEAMKRSQDIYLNQLMSLQDVEEGLRAVLEKRKPVWKNK